MIENNTGTGLFSGLEGLDRTLRGVLPGDSFVWQIDAVDDYVAFVKPLAQHVKSAGGRIVYYRFAEHEPLLQTGGHVRTVTLDPDAGFECFINQTIDEIEGAGQDACHVFDCLSDLAADWFSDRMLGNFFVLASSSLIESGSMAYFAIMRNRHSVHATDSIHEKARVVLDVYRDDRAMYIHPVKVKRRHSSTMYMLHRWKDDSFEPVTSSAVVSDILTGVPQPWLDFTIHRLGVWTRTFIEAEKLHEAVESGAADDNTAEACREKLLRMAVSREDRFLDLARKHLTLADILEIRKRMIGTGLIGGKAFGMIIARAVLSKNSPRWKEILEAHDSFFIGSDVFFTYLVQNGCWTLRRRQRNRAAILEGVEEAREKMLRGDFPKYITAQFGEMLNYFGQTPIIVRSSSLMEDNYGNSFSGKYESVFCANQGSPAERMESFLDAVRRVYASAMSREALLYREQKGLLEQDEQMAILVQRVSGDLYNNVYLPQVAGVGYSFNPYVWSGDIDPHQGVLRLVFGLGTRAVDRHDDDYTRIVALNAPNKRPESSFDEVRRYAQRKVDLLDLDENRPVSPFFEDIAPDLKKSGLPMELFASGDAEVHRRALENGATSFFPDVLTFEKLFSETSFIDDMREAVKLLQQAYNNPVDIEFTANFTGKNSFRVNLVQCRPFQMTFQNVSGRARVPVDLSDEKLFFKTNGPIIGNSASMRLDSVVFIVPSEYGKLGLSDRYSVARLTGSLTRHPKLAGGRIMLAGPGRWGTTTPALGVPVSFDEISRTSVLCEIAAMHEGMIPDVSLGTHFFNDLVEMDILYLAVIPGQKDTLYNELLFVESANHLTSVLPDAGKWRDVVKVLFSSDRAEICLCARSMEQSAICHLSGV